MSARGSPSKACEGPGGPAAPTRPARPAHDRPCAPGMECAYLKVSHVSQRTGPSFRKPPEAFGEAAWRWPQGPGASAVKATGSGALGSWARAPLQRPWADTGLPSHGVPHEPRGGPWRRGCGCSGWGPVYPSRAGDAVLEDREAGAPRAPRRLRKSGGGGGQCHTEWPQSDIRPTPATEPEPDRMGTPAPGLLVLAGS